MKSLSLLLMSYGTSLRMYHLMEMEIIMHLSKENVMNVRAQATKGLIYVKSVMGYKTVGPIIEKLVALEPSPFSITFRNCVLTQHSKHGNPETTSLLRKQKG
ncbi:hypothetical protein MXS87_21550 [Escherichia coli]|nr:hypothetical protein [Escherichia coli]